MKSKRGITLNPQVYFELAGASRRVAGFRKKQAIFSQGDAADRVIYIREGSVKLTVVNESGKEAGLAIFGAGESLGEGGIAGQSVRMGTATAMSPATVLIMGKYEMMRVLRAEDERSDRFIMCLL